MPGAVFSEGESVALHTIEDDDLDFLRRWRNDPAVRRPLTVNEPSNGEQTEQFFENAISSDEGANLLICTDGDPVGMISLFHEDRTAGTANVAYWVAPGEQGNGYATDAADLLCEHAFADRRLHKLRAEVLESNDGSRRVLEKVGFQREGVLREAKFVGGRHVDVYRYGLLAGEWGAA
jgi:RimJ/RimL family protein N-acetyltransferase